jgi:PmbA protein
MVSEAELREVAERALASATGETQVTVAWERGLIATGGGTRADDALVVEVTAVRDGGLGQSSTTGTDDDALASVVASAEQAAAASRDVSARLADPTAAPGAPHGGFDPAVAGTDPAAVALPEHMIWEAGAARVLVRSTRGVDAFEQRTYVRGTYDWRAEGRGVRLTAAGVGEVDLEALAREGRELGGDPPQGRAEAGDTAVVLGPQAVADVLEWLRWTFTALGEAHARSGSPIAASCITLADAPDVAGTLPRAFDVEGVPRQAVELVRDGVVHGVVWDTVSAAAAGADVASTGHAGQPGRPLPFPHHLVLAPGGAADAAELARPLERGLFLGAIPGVESAGEGVLRAEGCAAFAIRDGEIAEPLEDPRLELRPLELLATAQALTAHRRLIPTYGGARHVGATLTPALRAGGGIRVVG